MSRVKLVTESATPGGKKPCLTVSYSNLLTGSSQLSFPLANCELERKDDSTLILNRHYHISFPKSMPNYLAKRDFLHMNVDFWDTISGFDSTTSYPNSKE